MFTTTALYDRILSSSYNGSKDKSRIRYYLSQLTTALQSQNPNILTFAGPYGADAKLFAAEIKNSHVISVEQLALIAEKQRRALGHLPNVTFLRTSFGDFISGDRPHILTYPVFDCVFLDYIGTYTADKESEIRRLFALNCLAATSVFSATFSLCHDSNELLFKTDMYHNVCGCSMSRYRLSDDERENNMEASMKQKMVNIETQICAMAADANITLEPDQGSRIYRNRNGDTKGVWMAFLCFKVINHNKRSQV